MTERKTVDHFIMDPVRQAAEIIANRQGRELGRVAESIVLRYAATAEPVEGSVAKPAKRPPRDVIERSRVRFTTDREPYDEAVKRIRKSGKSVASVLEAGLEEYAKTGKY
jgi:hypothetical protein